MASGDSISQHVNEQQLRVGNTEKKNEKKYKEFKQKIIRSYEISDEDYTEWVLCVKAKLGILEKTPWNLSIYKVPSRLRRIHKDLHRPQTVSIGPLHHRKREIVIGEEHKWTYMLHLIKRSAEPLHAIEKCAEVIRVMEEEARRSYAENFKLEKHEMMEILLVDGCFMLETFIRYSVGNSERDQDDPILGNKWLVQDLQQDFALLENKIPFTILVKLFDTIKEFMKEKLHYSIHNYALFFFHSALNLSTKAIKEKSELLTDHGNIKHIVDMLYLVYLSTIPKKVEERSDLSQSHFVCKIPDKMEEQSAQEQPQETMGFEQSARELHNAGIQFKKRNGDQLLNITFDDGNGTLTVPSLCINTRTNSIFRNLIAFEQCSSGSTCQMLSYAKLMTSLIKSSDDVKLLEEKGIIKRTSGGREDVLSLFQGLCKEVDLETFYYATLCAKFNEYMIKRSWCQKFAAWFKNLRHRSYVALKDEIFATTWSILSVVAAFILLGLTALQTIYTLITYYYQS